MTNTTNSRPSALPRVRSQCWHLRDLLPLGFLALVGTPLMTVLWYAL